MNHALITGGAGSIGFHLARRLVSDGWKVTLLDNFERAKMDADLTELVANPRVFMLDLDLSDVRAIETVGENYTHLFHLAAILGVQNVLDAPARVLDLNVALTHAALKIANRQDALDRFVFASTSEVYAGTLQHYGLDLPTPETTPIALPDLASPRTSYMLSKLYGEALCLHSNLSITIVRPHNIYGPRMGHAHVIPQMLERAWALDSNKPFDVHSAEHSRTFCFVEDAVEMILRLATAPEAMGQVVNLGCEEPEITMEELAGNVLHTVGCTAELRALPATEGSPQRRAPDMTRCFKLTQYSAQTSLSEGLARTFDWYRSVFENER